MTGAILRDNQLVCIARCSLSSSAEPQLVADGLTVTDPVNAGPMTVGGPVFTAASVGGLVSGGSLQDLLNVNIRPPMIAPLDATAAPLTTGPPSLPTYDMAVAASNRHKQQQQQPAAVMTSLTDDVTNTRLLSGSNTLLVLPQVQHVHSFTGNSKHN